MDEDFAWPCTQAVCTDDRPDADDNRTNNFGCIVFDDTVGHKRYDLKEGDNTVGRHQFNHIYIEHPSVSMYHAVIQCDSDGLVLKDEGSLNKTKMNKKTLKKDVAYFLDENALLMFGEVRANYYVNGEPSNIINEVKANASDKTSLGNITENAEISMPLLSNTVLTSDTSFRKETADKCLDFNTSLVKENNSINEIEKEISKTINEFEYTKTTHDNIHSKLNCSSPSDEFLLDAVSQIENEAMYKITREETPSPVMDFKSSFSTINQISNNISQTPNKTNSEEMREDTPSPVMDFKSSFSTINQISNNISQTPNKTHSDDMREDTPSPVMDLRIFEKFEISNHNIHSANESTNNIEDLNETQCLEINSNFTQHSTQKLIPKNIITHTSKSSDYTNLPNEQSLLDECTQLPITCNDNLHNPQTQKLSPLRTPIKPISMSGTVSMEQNMSKNYENTFDSDDDDIFFDVAQIVENSKKTEKLNINLLDNNNADNISSSNKINSTGNGITQHENGSFNKSNNFNCPNHDKSMSSFSQYLTDTQKNNINSIEIDDDDMFRNFITENSTFEFESQNLIKRDDEDCFNCPPQNVSISKKIHSAVSSTTDNEETQTFSKSVQENKPNLNNTKHTNMDDNLTLDFNNDDFFNCPTQKMSIKNKAISISKLSPSLHEAETQKLSEFVKSSKVNSNNSKNCDSDINEDLTQNPELEDEDFFNCPTQKVSFTHKAKPVSNLSPSLHEAETQKLSEFNQPRRVDSSVSKQCTISNQKDLTLVPELEVEDFFNCPTQKISITSKAKSISKLSLSLNKAKTQKRSEFNQPKKADSNDTKHCTTSLQMDLTQIPELEDDDFFNCPTQRVSITSKGKSMSKLSLSLYEAETQKLTEFKHPSKANSSDSKDCTTSVQMNLTRVSELEDEDFFNCPTQKISITSKEKSISKLSPSLYEAETQKLTEYKHPRKADSSDSKDCTTSVQMNLTRVSELEDEDFFNCPTQKISITSKEKSMSKLSPSLFEAETQKLTEYKHPRKADSSDSKDCTTSVQMNLTRVSELEDEDFFNCPTQKISITSKEKSMSKLSPSLFEAETQKLTEFKQTRRADSNGTKHCATNLKIDLTRVPELEDEDFFNCPTQKLSITNKMKSISKFPPSFYEADTQNLSAVKQPNEISNSKRFTTINDDDLTQIPEMNNEDIFNRPTQKNSSYDQTKFTTDTNSFDTNENETQDFILQPNSRVLNFNMSSLYDNKGRNKGNIFEYAIPNKMQSTSLSKDENGANASIVGSEGEPSTSNNIAPKWKSLCNKKKTSSQGKEKSGKQENNTSTNNIVKKERYQTRAITKKENDVENSKKRKQDNVNVENNSKRMCDGHRELKLNPSVENTPEFVVTFSYLRNRKLKEMIEFVDTTGGSVTDEMSQCTVLVTDKIRCTMKILSAIAKGCPIVNVNWLKHSYTVKKFQDVDEFIITDKDAERKYKFRLKESLTRARTSRLLDGYTVLVTPSVKPSPKEMKVIVTCAGGKFVVNWLKKRSKKDLIVTCDQDRQRWKSMWDNDTAKMVDSDTLVMSIIRQKLNV